MRNTHCDKRRSLKKINVKLGALTHRDKSRSVKHKRFKVGGRVRHQNRRAGIDEPGHPRREAGMRSGKAGCRIPTDLKRGNGGEGTAQRRFCWPGAGGVGGAAGSAPDTFAVNAVPWMKRVRANGTLPPYTRLHNPKRTEPFHPTQGPAARSERNLSTLHKAPQPEANGTLPPTAPPKGANKGKSPLTPPPGKH